MCELRPQRQTLSRILGLIVGLALLAFAFPASAAAVTEDWVNEDFNFSARMMASDRDGDVYVLGDTAVGDYLVIKKFSAGGALLWQTTYRPANRLRGVWIAVDSAKKPVIAASIVSGSSGDPAGWVTLKLDAQGAVAWVDTLPGGFSDVRRVAIDAFDNIYVAGRMWLNGTVTISLDSVLIKYSPAGARLWGASFDNGGAVDEPYSMAISPDGSRIGIAGKSGNMFMALMYDAAGNRLWASANPNVYPANDLAFGPGNVSYFATGTYHPQSPDTYQMAIAKFDAAGTPAPIRSYAVGDRATRVRVDSQGNVVAAGLDGLYMDWMTIKTDAAGNLLWSRRYDGGRNNDETVSMLLLGPDDSVYVTGNGGPNPSTGTVSYLKGIVAKYAPDGSPQWAVWDIYSNGKAMVLGAGNTFTTLAFGYMVTTRYTQTGQLDALPAAPTGLSATPASTYVNLNFVENANNEFWVEIERCTGAGCTDFVKVTQSLGENSTGARDSSVARGTTYTYRARAVGFMGASGYSNTVVVTVPGVNLPAAPSGLTAVMSGTNVALAWTNNATNSLQFYIERCQGAGCANFIGWSASSTPAWTDYNATAGQSYSYRVRAWNSDGYSGYSNTATITVPGAPPVPPAAPSQLTAAISGTAVALNWTGNAANTLQFYIERCQGAGCTSFVEAAASTTPAWTDNFVVTGQSYSYRVRAWTSAGYSGYSNTTTISVPGGTAGLPAAPTGLAGSATGTSQIRITWLNGAGIQDAVKIERCRGIFCTSFALVATVSGTSTAYTDSGLSRNTAYRYRVRSHNSTGDSAYSNVAGVRTAR